MNIIKNSKLRNGREIYINEVGYANFKCEPDGIKITCKSKPCGSGYTVPIDSTGYAGIPKSIRVAYGLYRSVQAEKTKDYIYIHAHTDKIPKPFCGISASDDAEIPKDKMRKLFDCNINSNGSYRVYISSVFPKEWKFRKTTVHVGACLRIDVQEASRSDLSKYPSYVDLKEEYGACLQFFAGSKLVFVNEIKTNSDYNTITIPKNFKLKTELTARDALECFVTEDKNGKKMFVFSPTVKTCDFTGTKIDPKKEIPQKEVICKQCSDKKDDIGNLLKEVAAIKQLLVSVSGKCNEYHKKCDDLIQENRELAEQLLVRENKLRSVLEILSN